MRTNTYTDGASAALKSMGIDRSDETSVRRQLERIKDEGVRLARAREEALMRAETTHAYRSEVATMLGVSEDDVRSIHRAGLLGEPLQGYKSKHMFDRRAIHALIAYRDMIAGER